MLSKQELAILAIETAERMSVNPALVCAIIEVSSGWDAGLTEFRPSGWLMMQESTDLGGMERWQAMATRWGPMQVLGQEAFFAGFKEVEKLPELAANLEAGCQLLKQFLLAQKGDERNAVLMWYGSERRELALKTLAVLSQFKHFVEARPI